MSTAVPIIAPIPLLIIGVVLTPLYQVLPDWIFFGINMSFGAMFMFGIPYCMLICVLLVVLWDRSWKDYVIAALLTPVLMIPVVAAFLWLVQGTNPMHSALEYAPYCLGTGYVYVGVALFGLWLLIRTERIATV